MSGEDVGDVVDVVDVDVGRDSPPLPLPPPPPPPCQSMWLRDDKSFLQNSLKQFE